MKFVTFVLLVTCGLTVNGLTQFKPFNLLDCTVCTLLQGFYADLQYSLLSVTHYLKHGGSGYTCIAHYEHYAQWILLIGMESNRQCYNGTPVYLLNHAGDMLMSTLRIARELKLAQEELDNNGCLDDLPVRYHNHYDAVALYGEPEPNVLLGNDSVPTFRRKNQAFLDALNFGRSNNTSTKNNTAAS